VVVGLLGATSLLVLAGTSQETDPVDTSRPSAIEAIFPEIGAVIRPQETVGIDLRDDLRGVIIVDGTRIPEDQYTGDENLGVVRYRPGPDQEFRAFEPGIHEIVVEYWPRTLSEDDARRQGDVDSYGWRFVVG
jgi:hypothetical protein